MAKKDEFQKNVKLEIVNVPIEQLIPADYNPRYMKEEDRQEIKASLQKFGFVEPVVVNKNPDRMNIIVGGHQRVTVAKEDLHFTEVPCVFIYLTLEQEKELNLRLNKNTGRWNEGKLEEFFTKDFLKSVGFQDEDLKFYLSEFEKKFDAITDRNCEMPLVPKFSEKYDAVIIVSENAIDTTFLKTTLKIDKSKSYKNQHTGEAMIINVEHLKNALYGD